MSANVCLFCNDLEIKYKPETGNDFICSRCVQILISATQEELKRAHSKTIEKGYTRKAKAIESFLIEEEVKNERKTKKLKRNMGRKRPVRKVRPTRDQFRPQSATIELD